MTKKVGVSIVLISLFCLAGCGIRVTGPCLGYGCPMASVAGASNASNMTPKPAQEQATAARNAALPNPQARAGQ